MDQKAELKFVLTNEIVGSAFHEEKDKNMKYVEKLEEKVWQDKDSGNFAQGSECPFEKGTLVAGLGDLIPDVSFKKKATKKKVENKAVKPSEDK
jgi:hypothetical protein